MQPPIPLFPEQASTMAARVDNLYFFMVATSAFFAVLVTLLVIAFAIRFRRRSPDGVGEPIHGSLALELIWTGIPFVIAMVMFVWGASVYFALARMPDEALDIYAVGKQWMWKFQHREGQREINELHVPVNTPVRVIMTSEDVLHDLYFPSFRTKTDAIPGRYTQLWFTATTVGTYHIFCAEYCGTNHSGMIGRVVVMPQNEYEAWLGGAATEGSLAQRGEKLFTQFACITCHRADSQGRGPLLNGVFGRAVSLANGNSVIADAAYVRESILNPTAKVVAGFAPIMPTFQGQVSEEQLLALTEYIKSLPTLQQLPGAQATPPPTAPAPPK
jgi:cytochrome c oxidase subunit 2